MKKSYLLVITAVFSMGLVSMKTMTNSSLEAYTESHLFSSGNQPGLTGAPGESNCTQCHAGTTQDGTSENTFSLLDETLTPVTGYVPGGTYTANLQMVSNPVKKGFSAVVLDNLDLNAGSFVGDGIGGTQNFSNLAATREYVSHTTTSSTFGTNWYWTWNAPSVDVGDVTFYIASNKTNDNGATSGDIIYLSQHIIGSTANISENSAIESNFEAGYSPNENKLFISFNSYSVDNIYLNVVDMTGKSVFTYDMGESILGENEESIVLPSDIENGMYVVNFFVGNKPFSSKIIVTK